MKQNDTTVRFDEKLLTAYFAGAATPDEERMLWEWICASDENRRVFAELRAVWQRGRMQRPDTQLPARFVRSLNGLNRRIDALDAAPVRKGRLIPLRRFAAAAAVAAILVASFMTYRIVTAPFVHSFHNADTVAMHVAMPDGTDVWLGPGTSLSYDDTFRVDGRNVELDGEAYFDVTPNTPSLSPRPHSGFACSERSSMSAPSAASRSPRPRWPKVPLRCSIPAAAT